MLYGVQPIVPPAIRERFGEPINLDNTELAIASYLRRAELVKQAAVIAGNNLKIAQHRDQLQYARRRTGAYMPKARKFQVGDFVYIKKQRRYSVYPTAGRTILRIVSDKGDGVWILQGRDGLTTSEHVQNMAPCHLPNLDTQLRPSMAVPDKHLACEVCNFAVPENTMLLCDVCSTGWHTHCLNPPFTAIPEGNWICPRCTLLSLSPADIVNELSAAKLLDVGPLY